MQLEKSSLSISRRVDVDEFDGIEDESTQTFISNDGEEQGEEQDWANARPYEDKISDKLSI